MVLQSSEFCQNDSHILSPLRHLNSCQFLNAECIGPVVSHGTEVIEPVRVRHRAEITGILTNLLVIPMQITENRFELPNGFSLERDVHRENAASGCMLRSNRDLE